MSDHDDEMVCGESHDHTLSLIDERDGCRSYECRECGAEIIEDEDGNPL